MQCLVSWMLFFTNLYAFVHVFTEECTSVMARLTKTDCMSVNNKSQGSYNIREHFRKICYKEVVRHKDCVWNKTTLFEKVFTFVKILFTNI